MTNETNLKEGKNSILAAVSANVGKLILEKEKKKERVMNLKSPPVTQYVAGSIKFSWTTGKNKNK